MSTLKVDQILKRTGTGTITLGQSGDTISIPSGTTLAVSGTATGVGGVMTPAFEAYKASSASVSNNTAEKMVYDTESFDVGGCYDHSSNYRFTPTTAGKYFVYHTLWMSTEANGNFEVMWGYIYKNGSNAGIHFRTENQSAGNNFGTCAIFAVLDLVAGDYIEIYGFQFQGGTQNVTSKLFEGYRLTS